MGAGGFLVIDYIVGLESPLAEYWQTHYSSPNPTFARALDTNNVRIDFDEPLDPNSVQKEDFRLFMAGPERPISSASIAAYDPAVDPRGQALEAGLQLIELLATVGGSAR